MSIIPKHVAIILDGNRRWAQEKGKLPLEGHKQGAFAVERAMKQLRKQGVHTITIWIFSTENWQRSSEQVAGLLRLFETFADTYFKDALIEETRIIHLGRKDRLPTSLRDKIEKIEKSTAHFTERILNIALDYGGRDEVLRAVARSRESGAQNLDEKTFMQFLDTSSQPYPEPDMIIRTGGETRMSGFMIWQGVYAEYFFLKKYLPDVSGEDMVELLAEYQERKRRFGK